MSPAVYDAVVVGAGPAGLAAAGTLAGRGHSVLLVDEGPVPGGRLKAQWYRLGSTVWDGAQEVRRLVNGVAGGATWRLGTSAQAISGSAEGGFAVDLGRETARARTVLIATGATEVPLPMPGWTMPGVLAVGAAQTLWRGWHIPPGTRGVIVGANPLGFAVAQELADAELASLAVVMPPGGMATAHLGSVGAQWDRLLALAAGAPPWAKPVARLLQARPRWRRAALRWFPSRGIRVAGARLQLTRQALALEGGDRVEAVVLQRLDAGGEPVGAPWREAVDFVLLAGGLRPLGELLGQVGAAMGYYEGLGGDVPLVTSRLATSRPGVFSAGSTLGIESARVAMAQGGLAGLGMAAQLGDVIPDDAWRGARAAIHTARRQVPFTFQPGLEGAHDRHRRDSAREVGP
ncbi:MAG: FAD-dependent oxidoreductase [Thermaerobacter sp.]|nr:FAD-dependent oxidoreductase [Thermaerobacter sp.]